MKLDKLGAHISTANLGSINTNFINGQYLTIDEWLFPIPRITHPHTSFAL